MLNSYNLGSKIWDQPESEKTESVTISIPLKWWKKLKSTELLFVVFNWNKQSIVTAATLILIFRDIIKLGMFTAL